MTTQSERSAALLCAGLLLVVHFWVTTRQIAFPFWYHWDEESKAAQIASGARNLNHPLLLLNTVAAVRKAVPEARGLQEVTVLGRSVSAAFAAAAIAGMSLAAWTAAGPLAGVMAGILLALDPWLFEAAHYFKEDTALVFGWGALIACVAAYGRCPTPGVAGLVGVAAAMAASGKYIGILPAVLALAFLWRSGKGRGWTTMAFLVAFVGVFAAVNAQLVLAPRVAAESVAEELERQFRNDTLVGRPWARWAPALGVGGIAAAAIGLLRLARDPGPDRRVQWFALATAAAYFACLCFVVRMASRYMLPIYLVSWWFAGIGAAWLVARAARRRLALVLSCVLVAGLLAVRADAGWSGWKGFAGPDTRIALARRLDGLAQPRDQVMVDFTVNLPGAYGKQRHVDGWMPSTRMVPVSAWSPTRGRDMYESLLREGFTLVAVRPDYARRYSLPSVSEFGQYADREWRRPFYERLLREGRVEAVVEGVEGSFLSPPLALIRIADLR